MDTIVIKNRYFGDKKFYWNAIKIAFPIMLQSLIQSLISLIDNFMVAGLGDVSMSGVNISNQLIFVFMVFVNTICMTGGIFLTQFYGAKDTSGMKQAFVFKIILAMTILIPYFGMCCVFPKEILSLMVMGNTQADVIITEGVKYIRILNYAGLPWILSLCVSSSLRDMGRVKEPLVISICATLVNTALNYVFIYGHLGFAAMGVEGAACATLIARLVEFMVYATLYLVTKPDFSLRGMGEFAIKRKLFIDILKRGGFMLFCEVSWAITETITTALYNGRGGADVVSGMAASFAIANLFFVSFEGIYSATSVIIGRTLGEGNLNKARQEKKWFLSGAIIFGCIMTFFGLATTFIIPIVFGNLSSNALTICRNMIIMMSLFMPLWVLINAQQAIARAGGDTKMGAYGDAAITIFVVMPMLFILVRHTNIGPVQMYFATKILDIVKITVFYFWLKKERWLNNLTVSHTKVA